MNLTIILSEQQDNAKYFVESWEFWLVVSLQIVALVSVIWRASIRLEKKLTEITDDVKRVKVDITDIEEVNKKMDERVDRIEEKFNHKFTEYKDFVRDQIDSKMNTILQKVENGNICTSKKLSNIEKSLHYLKGRLKIGLEEEHEVD